MRCPACGFDNLIGADICDNCGADLAGRDLPPARGRSTAGCSVSTSTSSAHRRR